MMRRRTLLSKESLEELYPGLLATLDLRVDQDPKFLLLSGDTNHGYEFFIEDSPKATVTLIQVPYIDGDIQVRARILKNLPAINNKQFTVPIDDDLNWRGFYFVLMVNDCRNLYLVEQGDRPDYAPEMHVHIDGAVGSDYTFNEMRGEWNEGAHRYEFEVSYLKEIYSQPLWVLMTGFSAIKLNNKSFVYGHNSEMAVWQLPIGGYSYASIDNADYAEVKVSIRLSETEFEVATVGITYGETPVIYYSWKIEEYI